MQNPDQGQTNLFVKGHKAEQSRELGSTARRMLTIALSVLVASLLLYIISQALNTNKYWKNRGVKGPKPLPFVGNILPTILNKKSVQEIYVDLLNTSPDEPIIGFYDFVTPVLVIQDPDYIEKILIKDFTHFMDHSVTCPDEKSQPIDHYNLFSLTGSKWRAYRYKMSPLFTSGKLKQMHEACEVIGNKLIQYLDRVPKKEIELRNAMHLFTMDFVGLSVFGLNACVLENPNCEYRQMGSQVFDLSLWRLVFMMMCPSISNYLGISFNNKQSVRYFTKVIEDAFKYRKENDIRRNDFIQMMIQLKEKGKLDVQKWDPNDEYLKAENTIIESFEISDISLIAQAYAFLTTGLDAVALTLMYGFYELALHQDIQNKTRQEILEQTKLHSGLTYDAMKCMTYSENVIHEILRLYPLSRMIMRVCVKDYTLPNGFTIKAGDNLHISPSALHLSPNYHSDPLKFVPERFDYPMRPGTYFPFGDGPRVCIAMRFALLQIKYGLALVLSNYKVKLSAKTKIPLKMKSQSVMMEPTDPIYFDLEEL